MTKHFKITGPDVIHEDFGGELVVLNLATGQYFGLNSAGATLWSAIVSGQSPDDISGTAETSVTITAFVDKLMALKLIVQDDQPPMSGATSVTLNEAPTIEVYDDLSDLIVADPIHDVDAEFGWPKTPETA